MAEFNNPNQPGGQDNKSLFAMMFLVVAVLFGSQYYHQKINPQPAPAAPAAVANPAPAAVAPAASNTTTAVAAAAPGTPAPRGVPAAPAIPTVQAAAESTTVVENELYRITFSNRGAQVTSWVLKRYPDDQGKSLDIVHQQAAKLFGYPLSLYTYDRTTASIAGASRHQHVVTLSINGGVPAGVSGRALAITGISDSSFNGTYTVTQTGPTTLTYDQGYGDDASSTGGSISTVNGATGEALSNALFVPSATGTLAAPASLTFTYSNGSLQATKTFTFDPTYVLHADVKVTRNGVPERALLSWPGGFGDQNETPNMSEYSNAQLDSDNGGTEQHLAPKKISGGDTINGPFDWVGVSDPFFAAVFLPDSPATATVATLDNVLDVSKTIKRVGFSSGSAPTKANNLPILGAALGDLSGTTSTRLFVGPKAIDVLKGVHAANPKITLEPMLEFGFWGLLGKYLFLSLHLIHDHVVAGWSGSWGWAIIILTILINILILPFRVKSMRSALKMQRIQPQIEAIKAKYKNPKMNSPKFNDMNAEVMQFQKDSGVNMFGGCIPTLITLPLLYAFYTMLPRVVELRQAHWLWLPNLQAADPYHILPIVTALSQFIVQYYTPSPGVDPQQQKMMAFMMPAFFGYIMWYYASGLGLYWAIGNLISIGQQAVMNKTSLGREMREIAAKRARRKAGATIQAKR